MTLDECRLADYGYTVEHMTTKILFKGDNSADILDMSAWKEITQIERELLRNIANLKKVILPPNLKIIDKFAFEGCKKLEEVVFNDNLVVIRQGAFKHCGLKTFIAPKNLELIESEAFLGNSIENVKFNDKLCNIYNCAFENNEIRFVIIPENLDTGMNCTVFLNQRIYTKDKLRYDKPTIFVSKFFNEYEKEYFEKNDYIVKENTIENIIASATFKGANKILKESSIER